ncbi:MAG: TonB-dependent receptor [Rhizobiales bacterium]|nr:TonB-dependent receptor [Hyphomicrobiales bacterium]
MAGGRMNSGSASEAAARTSAKWSLPLGLMTLAFGVDSPALAQVTELPVIVVEAPRREDGPQGPSEGELTVIDRSFAPVSVVREGEIRRNGGRTIGDLLGNLPGITNSGFAPGSASRPIIRGLDAFRVRIQENGVGTQDVSDLGEDHGVTVDPSSAQRVDVVRGPAVLRYGSQAIGGVVNVSNERIPTVLGPEGIFPALRTALSSVDRGVDSGLSVSARKGNIAFHGEFNRRTAEDYATPGGGRQANSYLRAMNGSIGATLFFDGGYWGAAIAHTDATYGIPGRFSAAERARIDLRQTRVTSKGEYRPESGPIDILRFWFGASVYAHNEDSFVPASDRFVTALTFRNQEAETRVEAQMRPLETAIGPLTITTGVSANYQLAGATGSSPPLFEPATTQTAASYLFGDLQVTPTTRLQASSRIEYTALRGIGGIFPVDYLGSSGPIVDVRIARSFLPFSASIGVLQDLPWNFVGSLTAQFVERAPRVPELFSKGAHAAPGTFDIGNPNLNKEQARTFEIGLRRAAGPLRLDMSAYYTSFNGFIFKSPTGLYCDETFASCGTGTAYRQTVFRQRDATFYGAEFRAQYDLAAIGTGMLGIEAQYDFVRARFSDDTNVPRIPPHRLGGGVFWRDGGLFARVSLLHAFAQRQIAANETPTAGYDLLNAELSYTTRLAGNTFGVSELTAGIVGTNLLDAEIRNHVSFKKDEVVQPGRGVRAFVNIRF